MKRLGGVSLIAGIVLSTVGFSIYFALGVVAERGLGLTPLVFLGAGLLFILATLSYSEAASMFPERGGSSTFARYAFNELVSFVAGWALLIDYIIVIAIAAITVPHYLEPIWSGLDGEVGGLVVALLVIGAVAAVGISGAAGRRRPRLVLAFGFADLLVQLTIVIVGAFVVFDTSALTAQFDPFDSFGSPTLPDLAFALTVAMVAFAGIEVAADLAPDFRWKGLGLRRTLTAGSALVPLLYASVSVIALMAVPVVMTGSGPQTELGSTYIDAPVLGVVMNFTPEWLSTVMQALVVVTAPIVLCGAAATAMLGLSRHVYTLATHRQIPSWLGKLNQARSTPHIAILIATVMAIALALPRDLDFLAGAYAFGVTLAFAIAHLSVLQLRRTRPRARRVFRIPGDVRIRGVELPLPALIGAVLMLLAFASVLVFHEGARYLGGGWMIFGLVGYVVYRRVFEGVSVFERLDVPEEALHKREIEAEYGDILVPIFGTTLDDQIVSTAGRVAAASDRSRGGPPPRLEVVYVMELPLTVPLESRPPEARMARANAAMERAQEVGDEYEGVEVATSFVRARAVGQGIVETARQRDVEVIVMGAEPPSKIRGGAILGGIGGSRPDEIGPVTEYVLRRAPCRVILTAPPDPGEAVALGADGAGADPNGGPAQARPGGGAGEAPARSAG
ncbi:amino acid permease [Thermoleophilia bacterium SCSIO 60948]|nr:amino acid permease [Thermoleophilia bacterium SCSIO 60948]